MTAFWDRLPPSGKLLRDKAVLLNRAAGGSVTRPLCGSPSFSRSVRNWIEQGNTAELEIKKEYRP